MHSLMSLSSPVPEFGAEAKRNCFKQTKASHNNVFPGMSTVQSIDLILDNHHV